MGKDGKRNFEYLRKREVVIILIMVDREPVSKLKERFDDLERKISYKGGAVVVSSSDRTRQLILTGDDRWLGKDGDTVYDLFDPDDLSTGVETVLIEYAYLFSPAFRKIINNFTIDNESECIAKQREYLSQGNRKERFLAKLVSSMEHSFRIM